MKEGKLIKIAAGLAILLTLAACTSKGGDNGSDNGNNVSNEIEISIEKIERYSEMEITDWLDEGTVIVAKENTDMDKMSLLERAEFYPRGIYLYSLETKEFEELIAQENMFLGGARLSPDKEHLLFYEYSIGDTAYFLLSMNEIKEAKVKDGGLGLAMTADWDDDNKLAGVSYAGGAYIADTDRNIAQVEGLEEQLFIVKKFQEKLYYVTLEDNFSLYIVDLVTGEKKDLMVDNVDRIVISPDGKQILITVWDGEMKKLLLTDSEGNIISAIAEGNEIYDAAWSSDSKMIAYHLNLDRDGSEKNNLYLYDVSRGKVISLIEDLGLGSIGISWSPSGEKIALSQLRDSSYDSKIIYLKQN